MATTLSQAGSLQNVLNSPQYAQELQDYYLSTYAPGLTQATFGINAARNAFQANEGDRTTRRGEAVRRIAGDYASRGMRTPGAINRDRSRVQGEFAAQSREEQARIADLENQRDVQFGRPEAGQTFMSNPDAFGAIGIGARRSALSGLQSLPEYYNLLGMGASTAPMNEAMQPEPQPVTVASLLPQEPAPAPAPRVVTPTRTTTARRTGARTRGAGMNRTYAR